MTQNKKPEITHDHLLQGQPKPTKEQVLWLFSYLADLCQSDGQSYGYVMQRMYGYPSVEKLYCSGPGMLVTNTINCALQNEECRKEIGRCYT